MKTTPTTRVDQSVKRQRKDKAAKGLRRCRRIFLVIRWISWGFVAEGIADAAHRLNVTWRTGGFELGAKIPDIDFEDVALAAEIVAPNAVVEGFTGEHLPG